MAGLQANGEGMIRITVSGDTYFIRQRLKDNWFQWVPKSKTWIRTVTEARLDKTLGDIRPPESWSDNPGPQIIVELRSVDVQGKEFNESPFKLKLRDVERPGVSILEEFRKNVSDLHVSPTSLASGPINPKEKTRRIDDGFY